MMITGTGLTWLGLLHRQAPMELVVLALPTIARLWPVKAAQYSGLLTTADIAEGIYYAVDNGADVINMSFGGYGRCPGGGGRPGSGIFSGGLGGRRGE